MQKNALIKRNLTGFGIDLEWDGREVKVKYGDRILEIYEARTGLAAGRVMERVEDECFAAASAMC